MREQGRKAFGVENYGTAGLGIKGNVIVTPSCFKHRENRCPRGGKERVFK